MADTMTVPEVRALVQRLAPRSTAAGSITGQVAALEADAATAARLIGVMLRQVHSSDVFELPPEA